MKHKITILIIVMFLLIPYITYAECTASDDAIGYFTFDIDCFTDDSSIGLDGTNQGADNVGGGKIGNACDFERGESDWINVTDTILALDTGGPMTVGIWIKIETANDMHPFSMGDGGANLIWFFHHRAGISTRSYVFAGGPENIVSTGAMADTDWHFWMSELDTDGGIVGFWKDNVAIGSQTATTIDLTTVVVGALGGKFDAAAAPTNTWDGLIDEVGIWDRALTSQERADLFNDNNSCNPFVEASPVITITNPSDGAKLDNITYHIAINGTAIVDNGNVDETWINNSNFKLDGAFDNFNFSMNGTLIDNIEYHIMIFANNSVGTVRNNTVRFTIDRTAPGIASTLDNNHTLTYSKGNFTFQINFTDNLQIYSFNVTDGDGNYLFNDTGLNTTNFIFNGSMNVTNLSVGRHTIKAEFCDAHTANEIGDWSYNKGSNKKIRFDNGLIIGAENSNEWDDVIVIKETSKYKFKYISKTLMDGATRRFIVEGKKKVFIYGNQKGYDAWLIVDNQKWVDHNLKSQPLANYKIIRINEKKVVIEISNLYGYELEFESAGDLNCEQKLWDYYIFNYTAIFTSEVVETTKDEITLIIDFADIVLEGNGTLNYNGVTYNVLNLTSTNQLNLSINFTIPQVSQNITNSIFFFNFILNTSSLTTINFTQTINRIQLAECGSLTNVPTLNISIFNEESPTQPLEASIDAIFNVWTNDSSKLINFTFNLEGASNYSICIFPNTTLNVNSVIFYNTSGGFDEKWFLRSARLTTNTSLLNLYNFDSQTGIDELRGILRDIDFNFFSFIFAELQRFYPGENNWRTVQMDQSDEFGKILFNIVEGTQNYRLNFIDDLTVIDNTGTIKFLCDIDDICDVTFIVERADVVSEFDLNIVIGYDNNTEIFQLNFTDTTGLTSSVRLIVSQESGTQSTVICDTTVSSSSGTINCDTTGYNGIIKAMIYKSASDETPFRVIIITKIINKLFKLEDIGKNEAGLWSVGIVSTLTIAGAIISPAIAIVIMIFSLIILNALSLLNFMTISVITMISVVGIVIAILLERRR